MTAFPLSRRGGQTSIKTTCDAAGLSAPPAHVKATLAPLPGGWLLAVAVDKAHAQATAPWLRCIGALDATPRNNGLAARFAALPDSLDLVVRAAHVDCMEAWPDGRLAFRLRAPQAIVEQLVAALASRPADRDAKLTERQDAILQHCVAAGYYAIPRPCTLRGLAGGLELSTASLSLILRRAESRVVAAYMGRKRAPPATTLAPVLAQPPVPAPRARGAAATC